MVGKNHMKDVNPTHVGMDRGSERQSFGVTGKPHARGDGPHELSRGRLVVP